MAPRLGNGELRRKLLDQARRLLVAEGVGRLSMRRLADDVGVSATSIYLYYRDKDALIHALIAEGMELLGQGLEAERSSTELPVKRIEGMCRQYLEFAQAHPEYYEIMFLLHPQHMERYPRRMYRVARHNLDLAVQELAAVDGLPVSTAHKLRASVMWSTLHGAASLLLASRFDASLSRQLLVDGAVAAATAAGCYIQSTAMPAGPSPC